MQKGTSLTGFRVYVSSRMKVFPIFLILSKINVNQSTKNDSSTEKDSSNIATNRSFLSRTMFNFEETFINDVTKLVGVVGTKGRRH